MTSIASTNSTTTSASTAASTSSATASSASLGQQQFLQLLVAQMQNQDPTAPMQGTEFVTQLAQFSMVEQSVQQTTALGTLSTQLGGISNEQATSLVGQNVTLSGSTITSDGSNVSPASVTLSAPASDATAVISDSSGNTIRTIDLGAQPGGVTTVNWDGRSDAGEVQPAGSYSVAVSATAANGGSVNVSSSVSGVVKSVDFSNGGTTVTLANGTQASVSALTSVGGTGSQ